MRISDWSSDVCSSDLAAEVGDLGDAGHAAAVVGRALADLNPAAVAQELLELAAFAAMVLDAGGDPGVGVGHRLHDHAGLGRCLDDVAEVGSRLQQVAEQWEERSEEHTSALQSLMRSSYA